MPMQKLVRVLMKLQNVPVDLELKNGTVVQLWRSVFNYQTKDSQNLLPLRIDAREIVWNEVHQNLFRFSIQN